jgi:DNA-binding LacI/PurR family transcriptional regulator
MTIRDVAARTGVSAATVSRVFAHGNTVSSATRQRVLAAVDELHYTPPTRVDLADRGRRVPEDISVVGFGDTSLAEMVSPALTTVRLQTSAAVAAAVHLLLDTLRGHDVGESTLVTLPAELIFRSSVGPAAAEVTAA